MPMCWGGLSDDDTWVSRGRKCVKQANDAYQVQVRNSRWRGIPFQFSLEEWITWWEDNLGPDWIKKRGCTKGKFCMSRRGDTGPYSRENVRCTTHQNNVTDAVSNNTIAYGIDAGHARLTPDLVLEVFHSTEPAKILAKRLDVSLGTINDIRGKRTWRRVTKDASRTSLRGRNQWVA